MGALKSKVKRCKIARREPGCPWQILLQPKQLHSALLSCLCIIGHMQTFPYPIASGLSLPPPSPLGDKSRLLETNPQTATFPERPNRLHGFFGGQVIFFSLFLASFFPFLSCLLFRNTFFSVQTLNCSTWFCPTKLFQWLVIHWLNSIKTGLLNSSLPLAVTK